MQRRLRESVRPGSVRRVVAWSVGIFTFVFGMVGQEMISRELGLATYIDFGETVVFEHRYYDQESDGAYTGLGWALLILTAMFSVRIGLAVYHKNWRGGVPQKFEID